MLNTLRAALSADERIAYALLFGSVARGSSRPDSDVDIAIGLRPGVELSPRDLGTWVASWEALTGRPVDVVLLDGAGPAIAHRVFRDGIVLVEPDPVALTRRKARAISEYLDFLPVERRCAAGALAAARRG